MNVLTNKIHTLLEKAKNEKWEKAKVTNKNNALLLFFSEKEYADYKENDNIDIDVSRVISINFFSEISLFNYIIYLGFMLNENGAKVELDNHGINTVGTHLFHYHIVCPDDRIDYIYNVMRYSSNYISELDNKRIISSNDDNIDVKELVKGVDKKIGIENNETPEPLIRMMKSFISNSLGAKYVLKRIQVPLSTDVDELSETITSFIENKLVKENKSDYSLDGLLSSSALYRHNEVEDINVDKNTFILELSKIPHNEDNYIPNCLEISIIGIYRGDSVKMKEDWDGVFDTLMLSGLIPTDNNRFNNVTINL